MYYNKMKFYFFLASALPVLLTISPTRGNADSLLLGAEQPAHVIVHNRILAKVNGKAISVVDIMKKMDILFYREYPQYTSSSQARFQFPSQLEIHPTRAH